MAQRWEGLAKQIAAGRLILFVGQDALRIYGSEPAFSAPIRRRFGLAADVSLHDWWLSTASAPLGEKVSAWIEASDHAPVSDALLEIANLHWSGIITSGIDGVLRKALDSRPDRHVLPIIFQAAGSALKAGRDPLTFGLVFGSVDRPQSQEQPPPNTPVLQDRRSHAVSLLQDLRDVLGSRGTLIVEGWDPRADWLRPRDFAAPLFSLLPGQVQIFSLDRDKQGALQLDEDFGALVNSGRATLHEESLLEALRSARAESLLPAEWGVDPLAATERLTLRGLQGRSFEVPVEAGSWRRFSRAFCVPRLDGPAETAERGTDRYDAFREFLRLGRFDRNWGLLREFGFRRSWTDVLLRRCRELLRGSRPQDVTVLLSGQAASGKSIGVAQIAIDITKDGYPVVYIPHGSLVPAVDDIDAFCLLVENAAAEVGENISTAIVWDGLRHPNEYSDYSRQLLSRGRRALVVGTIYPQFKAQRKLAGRVGRFEFVEARIRMLDEERERLAAHLVGIVPQLAEAAQLVDENFLASLYRVLPETRDQISTGLLRELNEEVRALQQRLAAEPLSARSVDNDALPAIYDTAIGRLLWRKVRRDLDAWPLVAEAAGAETESRVNRLHEAERLISIVMCAGQYGVPVPQELALRALGSGRLDAYQQVTAGTAILEEHENTDGSIDLEPRHTIEAQEIMRRQFNRSEQRDLIERLASGLRESDMVDQGTQSLECILRLLRKVGPQGWEAGSVKAVPENWLPLADVVAGYRARFSRVHPRLLLLEGNVRREWVQTRLRYRGEGPDELDLGALTSQIHKAEEAVEAADAELTREGHVRLSPSARRFHSAVKTEHGAILRTRQRLRFDGGRVLDGKATGEQIDDYELFQRARQVCREARNISEENLAAIDTEFWATLNYREQLEESDIRRQELLGDLFELLEEAEQLEFEPEAKAEIEEMRHKLHEVAGDARSAEASLERLAEMNPAAAAVLRVRARFGQWELDSAEPARLEEALETLNALGADLYQDRRALLLYTRVWWRARTGQEFFASDRQCVRLAESEWSRFEELMSKRLALNDERASATGLFYRAWARLQLRRVREALDDFDEIARLGAGVGRRARALAVLSDDTGRPQEHTGEVRRVLRTNRAFLWLPRLRVEVGFNPLEFTLTSVRAYQPIGPVHVALNYRGIYAESPARFARTTGRDEGNGRR